MDNPLVQVDPGLYIWTIVTFLVLVFALRRFAWAPLLKALEERQKTIAAAVEDAKQAREQLERVQQESAKLMAQARVEADALVTRARADVEGFRQEQRAKAVADADTIRKDAERQIQRETTKAIEQIRRETVDLSVAIASKLIRRQITAADQETLVAEALRDISQAGRSAGRVASRRSIGEFARRAMRRIDGLLVLMVLIWGVNYSVIKRAFVEIPPQPFNALRLVLASGVFLAAIRAARRRARAGGAPVSSAFFTPQAITARDRLDLLWLGLVGHCAYQFCFVGGVAATSVSNAALIIGATPVAVAVVSAALGRERIGARHWLGAAVSVTGLYFVVGHGAAFGGRTFHGDLLIMVSVGCWTAYTIGAGRLIARHSPLFVTGATMAVGTVPYVLITVPKFLAMDWAAVSAWTWGALVLSALLALNVAYLIWYMGVQAIGATRTSIYSNVVPIVAMTVAAIWLGESLTRAKLFGAAAVVTGVLLTRLGRRPSPVPIEE